MSIGGELAEVVAIEARRRRQPVGELVAELVHDFEIALGTCVWARAEQTMREAEQPVLAGLYVVVAHGLFRQNLAKPRRQSPELMSA